MTIKGLKRALVRDYPRRCDTCDHVVWGGMAADGFCGNVARGHRAYTPVYAHSTCDDWERRSIYGTRYKHGFAWPRL